MTLVDTDSVHGFIDFEYLAGIDATKQDRTARKRAAALTLRDRVGETFSATVSGTTPKATWLTVAPDGIEGRLVRGVRRVRVGDQINVVLLNADPVRGFIDFAREDTVIPAAGATGSATDGLRSPYRNEGQSDRRAGD